MNRVTAARCQVGLLVEPSADFAVAMFAAWRAGLGILPLPVEFPDARLRTMIADCRPFSLLASKAQAARAGELTAGMPDIHVLDMDATADYPLPAVRPTDPAFTVYTSGSTGTPKGVLIRQDQVARLLAWETAAWRLSGWVRMAQTLSLGFDFGLQELFTALPTGGALVVPAPADRRDARAYADFLRRECVTVLFTTPSFADELAATRVCLPDLRLVLIGGEVLRWSTVAALDRVVGVDCRLVNGYGPTEATVNCLAFDIPRDAVRRAEPSDIVPVGRASGPAVIHLLDGHGLPVPAGALGEIAVGGAGVAQGYLHRPDLTAERFVPGPDGDIVYRTGDLAYLRPDGEFVVVGRADRQVKLRGYRVEPAEVEAVLRRMSGITGAVVHVLGRPARMVAVVGGAVAADAVLHELAGRLPAALLPDDVIVLDRLPLTANGKLDQAAMRIIAERSERRAVPANASVGQVEQVICQVWGEVLDLDAVDPVGNVFDAGAHSLAATRAHGRIEALLGLRFPVSDLFEFPRPRDLAGRLGAHRRGVPVPDDDAAR
jgi:amino acid adenylation domain-containing protein